MIANVDKGIQDAKAAQAKKTDAGIKECIDLTTQTLKDLEDAQGNQ